MSIAEVVARQIELENQIFADKEFDKVNFCLLSISGELDCVDENDKQNVRDTLVEVAAIALHGIKLIDG